MDILPDSGLGLYKPLKRDEIRVLRIHKPLNQKDAEQFVRCSLEIVVLTKISDPLKPKYAALSYEWEGHVDNSQTLVRCLVNGHETFPRRNLLLALATLRSKLADNNFPIWIDAICINQQDTVERENQVRIMADIYSTATQLYAWLGQEQDQSSLAIASICDYSETFLSTLDCRPWLLSTLGDDRLTNSWVALIKLLDRSYWRRSWIVQELVLRIDRIYDSFFCGSLADHLFIMLLQIAGLFIDPGAKPSSTFDVILRAYLQYHLTQQEQHAVISPVSAQIQSNLPDSIVPLVCELERSGRHVLAVASLQLVGMESAVPVLPRLLKQCTLLELLACFKSSQASDA